MKYVRTTICKGARRYLQLRQILVISLYVRTIISYFAILWVQSSAKNGRCTSICRLDIYNEADSRYLEKCWWLGKIFRCWSLCNILSYIQIRSEGKVELRKEAPKSWKKDPAKYWGGFPISNLDLLLHQRCYTPYIFVLYTLIERILLPPTPLQSAQVLAPIFSPQKDQQTKSFSYCENYKISEKIATNWKYFQ